MIDIKSPLDIRLGTAQDAKPNSFVNVVNKPCYVLKFINSSRTVVWPIAAVDGDHYKQGTSEYEEIEHDRTQIGSFPRISDITGDAID